MKCTKSRDVATFERIFFSAASTTPESVRTPTAAPAWLIASMAYSTWYKRPSGLKVVVCESYLRAIGDVQAECSKSSFGGWSVVCRARDGKVSERLPFYDRARVCSGCQNEKVVERSRRPFATPTVSVRRWICGLEPTLFKKTQQCLFPQRREGSRSDLRVAL